MDSDNTEQKLNIGNKLVVLLPLLMALTIATGAAINLTGQRALRLPLLEVVTKTVQEFVPQGWGFFTKPPTDPRYLIYEESDDSYVLEEKIKKGASADSLYGINRSYRIHSAQLETFGNAVSRDDQEMTPCEDSDLSRCFSDAKKSTPLTMPNSIANPTFCGKYMVVRAEPTPYAWRNLVDESMRITHSREVEIVCPTD